MRKLSFVFFVFIALSAFSQGRMKFQYKGDAFILGNEYLIDRLDTFNIADLPNPKPLSKLDVKNATPLTECFWRMALAVVENNMIRTDSGKIIASSINNIGFAGIIGLNEVYPQQMKWSLKYSVASYLDGDVETHLDEDVVWIWAAAELFKRNPGLADWNWLYYNAEKAFKQYYNVKFDTNDGLFWGDMPFINIHSIEKIKATSINCLYLKAFEAMELSADSIGLYSKSIEWSNRKNNLRDSILKNLRNSDHTFKSFLTSSGSNLHSVDAMGFAFTVMSNIASPNDTKSAFDNYNSNYYGIALLPETEDSAFMIFNKKSKPISDALFLNALEKTFGVDYTSYNAALLIRASKKSHYIKNITNIEAEFAEGNTFNAFFENINLETGFSSGEPNNLLSATAFINICIRGKLVVLKAE